MRKLWKGMLVGAAVGAGVEVVRQREIGAGVATVAGEAAAAGAALGFLLDRRAAAKRRRSKKPSLATVLATAGSLAEAAKPKLAEAAQAARPKLVVAANVARDQAVHAAQVAGARLAELELPAA